MNFFAHAIAFLDDPYFVAGTGVPDWLTVVDRRVRVRLKHTEPFFEASDPRVASAARGIAQHIRDDAHFHGTRAFAELTLELSGRVRRRLGSEDGFRPAFLGHLLVELLLDAELIADAPGRLDRYYRVLESVEAARIEEIVNQMTPRRTRKLAPMIEGFRRHRILSDYAEDEKLEMRLNQIMRRVGFAKLPGGLIDLLPEARRQVAGRKEELLEGIPTSMPPTTAGQPPSTRNQE